MKIGLGSVQFGLDYGISNTHGMTSNEEVGRILKLAKGHGISVIDTASQYGKSEAVLGQHLSLNSPFKVVTKTPHFSTDQITLTDKRRVKEVFSGSLSLIGQQVGYGLLTHNCNDLLKPGGEFLFEGLEELKQDGVAEKIGTSVYSPAQLEVVLKRYAIDIVQLPFSIFDQRFLNSGLLAELKQQGVEVHARSAFLQGVLLMETVQLPDYLTSLRPVHQELTALLSEQSLSTLEAALGFVQAQDEIDVVVCGVNTASQLSEIVAAAKVDVEPSLFGRFAISNERLVDPSQWITK